MRERYNAPADTMRNFERALASWRGVEKIALCVSKPHVELLGAVLDSSATDITLCGYWAAMRFPPDVVETIVEARPSGEARRLSLGHLVTPAAARSYGGTEWSDGERYEVAAVAHEVGIDLTYGAEWIIRD